MTIAISNVTPAADGAHLSHMPFSVRIALASSINKAWDEFSGEMVDEYDNTTAEKFLKYLTRQGVRT